MQAIRVRHLGPTNTRGGRVKATSASGLSVTVPKTYSDDHSDERSAVMKLCKKLGWNRCDKMIRGGLDGSDSVFVFLPESCSCPASAFEGMRKRNRRGKRR
jgi:hypothetical protein